QARLNTAPASPSDGISPHELYSLQGKLFNHAEGLAYHLDQLEQKLGGHATDVMPSALSEMRDAAKEIDRIVKASVQGGQSVFDARELLAELQTAVFPGHRSFRIQTHSPSEPVTIHAERELLKSALLNLISNSIAHRDQRRELKVRVRLLTERGNALFEVHDTGKGIPAKRIPTLFSDFSSGRKPEERLQDSVHGTGLRIVHHAFTVAHPGELEVKSIIGSGTTFTGRIPLHD
ncbi:MAG: HAMP domain-containing sensor histidine kinase, partial [Candidatus Micrarchaeota archaeon]|nr:HAMP domain-containing sensor histidine kinase [Candidatus Micrarchaeota archaeon]